MADNATGLKNLKAAKRIVTGISIQQKFVAMRKDMNKTLLEREGEIDVVLTALLCKEHPLLVGPPGTAKSLLLDTLAKWMVAAKKFEVLYNKFTTPEEVFGPLDIKLLKEGKYRRVTTGMLPEAHFAFGDEVFKASSAILNKKLKVLNERKFEDGLGGYVHCPLIQFVAASNEWPNEQEGGKELGALFDRFLFRKHVRYISKASRDRLLWDKNLVPELTTAITPEEIEHAHEQAMEFKWSPEAMDAMREILDKLNQEGVYPGDRRMRKSVMAAQAFAYLNGEEEVTRESLDILAHVLWDDPTEQPEKCAKIVGGIANPTGAVITKKLFQAHDILDKCVSRQDAINAAPQIQAIQDELKALHTTDSRRDTAVAFLAKELGKLYNRITGVR